MMYRPRLIEVLSSGFDGGKEANSFCTNADVMADIMATTCSFAGPGRSTGAKAASAASRNRKELGPMDGRVSSNGASQGCRCMMARP